MKRNRILIFLIFFLISPLLFPLDVYLDGILWDSYNDSDLYSLRMEFPGDESPVIAVPFPLLLPVMEDTEEVLVFTTEAVISMKGGVSQLQDSLLEESDDGSWNLIIRGSAYKSPVRLEIQGLPWPHDQLLVWAEPGLEAFQEQVELWGRLHKIHVIYQEIPRLADEILHRKMTGNPMGDGLLIFQAPDEDINKNSTVAFRLQSCLSEGKPQFPLLLPSGFQLHPDLFLSILSSFSNTRSPWNPSFSQNPRTMEMAAGLYYKLILEHKILEWDDLVTGDKNQTRDFTPFPADFFTKTKGQTLGALPRINDRDLPPRIFPVLFMAPKMKAIEDSLLNFLKLPAIQHQLLSVENRQLPANLEEWREEDLTISKKTLLDEWKTGYILSKGNYPVRRTLELQMPDIFRINGSPIP